MLPDGSKRLEQRPNAVLEYAETSKSVLNGSVTPIVASLFGATLEIDLDVKRFEQTQPLNHLRMLPRSPSSREAISKLMEKWVLAASCDQVNNRCGTASNFCGPSVF
jgi:hypothetical protein